LFRVSGKSGSSSTAPARSSNRGAKELREATSDSFFFADPSLLIGLRLAWQRFDSDVQGKIHFGFGVEIGAGRADLISF
jgi:hypothetical protein